MCVFLFIVFGALVATKLIKHKTPNIRPTSPNMPKSKRGRRHFGRFNYGFAHYNCPVWEKYSKNNIQGKVCYKRSVVVLMVLGDVCSL